MNIDGEESFVPDYSEDADDDLGIYTEISRSRKVFIKNSPRNISTLSVVVAPTNTKTFVPGHGKTSSNAKNSTIQKRPWCGDVSNTSKSKLAKYEHHFPDVLVCGGVNVDKAVTSNSNRADDASSEVDVILAGDGIVEDSFAAECVQPGVNEMSMIADHEMVISVEEDNFNFDEDEQYVSFDATEEDFVVLKAVSLENKYRQPTITVVAEEEGVVKHFEEKFMNCLKQKNWDELKSVFQEFSHYKNLVEKLCFSFADLLSTTAEYSKIIKFLENTPETNNLMAMVGCKLIVNAGSCKQYIAGALILDSMLCRKLFFHKLKLKTFNVLEVTRSAVKACLKEKKYDVLDRLLKKTGFFWTGNSMNKKEVTISQLMHLNVVLQYFIYHTGSIYSLCDESKWYFSLATKCLNIVYMFTQAKQHAKNGKPKKFFEKLPSLPDGTWVLVKALTAGRVFNGIKIVIDLSFHDSNFINWSCLDYKIMINFFLEYKENRLMTYEYAVRFIDIMHREGTLPKFETYKGGKGQNILKLASLMNEEEIRLYIALYIESIMKHEVSTARVEKAQWSIQVLVKSFQASDKFESVLKEYFPYVVWVKSGVRYFIERMSLQDKDLLDVKPIGHSTPNVRDPILFAPSDEELPVIKNDSDFVAPVIEQNEKNASEIPYDRGQQHDVHSDIQPLAVIQPLLSFTVPIPCSILNHPRFKNSQSVNKPKETNMKYVTNHPRFKAPLEQQRGRALSRNPPVFSQGDKEIAPLIQSDADPNCETLRRLVGDISARVNFFRSEGVVSDLKGEVLKQFFAKKAREQLNRDSKGKIVYDDDAFEWLQSLINNEIQKLST